MALRWSILIIFIAFQGCWFWGQRDALDITATPSSLWTQKECLTVIMGAQNNNLLDFRTNIKSIATPYYPSVVKAIGRRAQAEHGWTEVEFRRYVDGLLNQGSGMFVDWDHPGEIVYDAALHPLAGIDQFDSLLFLLSLTNTAWPCGKVLIVGSVAIPLDKPDCEAPEITRIEGNIFLVNEDGKFITPQFVFGRRMNYLTNNDESLFILFKLREGDHHFLGDSRKFYLAIKGFENDIRLEFRTDIMR